MNRNAKGRMTPEKMNIIEEYSRAGRIKFKKHALIRLVERKIKIYEVEEALNDATIIASYPGDKPLESFLILGFARNKKPLHLVVALDEENKYLWIITVYEPDQNQWNDSLTKKRKP